MNSYIDKLSITGRAVSGSYRKVALYKHNITLIGGWGAVKPPIEVMPRSWL